ncbi:MAG: PaaI family thioesterase [Acidimicrobiales bacterium]
MTDTSGLRFAADGTFEVARSKLNSCFGCGQDNPSGLRLRFRLLEGGAVGTVVEVPAAFCGVDGVVHGGIQATILDEVSGVAAQLALPAGADRLPCVTADLALRFRLPVTQQGPVRAEATVERVEGRNIFVAAKIVDPDGSALTTATSRWVQLQA